MAGSPVFGDAGRKLVPERQPAAERHHSGQRLWICEGGVEGQRAALAEAAQDDPVGRDAGLQLVLDQAVHRVTGRVDSWEEDGWSDRKKKYSGTS